MFQQTNRRNPFFLVYTVLMALGSGAASLMELLVFLGVGWDYASFDFLLGITISSTFGLAVGAYGLFVGDRRANLVIVISSLYIPTALVALTLKEVTPPALWWSLLPLSLLEISLGLWGLRKETAATHAQHPHRDDVEA